MSVLRLRRRPAPWASARAPGRGPRRRRPMGPATFRQGLQAGLLRMRRERTLQARKKLASLVMCTRAPAGHADSAGHAWLAAPGRLQEHKRGVKQPWSAGSAAKRRGAAVIMPSTQPGLQPGRQSNAPGPWQAPPAHPRPRRLAGMQTGSGATAARHARSRRA